MENYQNYSLDCGHNCYPDTGATGIRQEDDLTKEVGSLVIQKLRLLGKTVTDCTPYGQRFNSVGGSLGYRVQQSNNSKSQFHICIHFNKFNGSASGVEVFAISQAGREVAQRICDEISSMGYINRGVKDGSGLYVVKYTNCPCVLVECAFCDSESDMNRYNVDSMANSIVKAVTGQTVQGGTPIQNPQPIKVVTQAPIQQPKPEPQGNDNVKVLQNLCNVLGVRDENGNSLIVDGLVGQHTRFCVSRLPLCGIPYTQREATKYIQTRLNQLGYKGANGQPLSIDGIFMGNSAYALKDYQRDRGLTSDSICGQNTWLSFLN